MTKPRIKTNKIFPLFTCSKIFIIFLSMFVGINAFSQNCPYGEAVNLVDFNFNDCDSYGELTSTGTEDWVVSSDPVVVSGSTVLPAGCWAIFDAGSTTDTKQALFTSSFLDVSAYSRMHLFFRYAFSDNASNPDDKVYLKIESSETAPVYYDGATNSWTTTITHWNSASTAGTFDVPIPATHITDNEKFSWVIEYNTGPGGGGVLALDNISLCGEFESYCQGNYFPLAERHFESCDANTIPPEIILTETGGGQWDISNSLHESFTRVGVVQGNCWAIYDEGFVQQDRTGLLLTESFDISNYDSLHLSFYFAYDDVGSNTQENVKLWIDNGTDRKYWNGITWKDNEAKWIKNNHDLAGTFSQDLPTSFFPGNTNFTVGIQYDDGGVTQNKGKGLAIDDFVLCGINPLCDIIGLDVFPQDEAICGQGGSMEVELDAQGQGPYKVELRKTSFGNIVYTGLTISGNLISIPDVPVGSYDFVTVTGSDGCFAEIPGPFIVAEPDRPSAQIDRTNTTCEDNNGSIFLTTTGGSGTYDHLWSNGATTQNIENLPSDLYSVTITDLTTTCETTYQIDITNDGRYAEDLLTVVTTAGCDSSASAFVDVKTDDFFEVLWSTGENTQEIFNLSPGDYTVTVTNYSTPSQGCATVKTVTVLSGPSPQFSNANTSDVNCNGDNDGNLSVGITGGLSPYTYNWEDQDGPIGGTVVLLNLEAGDYFLTVTDDRGCELDTVLTINEPLPLVINGTFSSISCFGEIDGSIDISDVTGGTAPYIYEIYDGSGSVISNNPVETSLPAGDYRGQVIDANGCSLTYDVLIVEPAALQITTSFANGTACSYSSDGSVNITVAGGTGDYDFLWNNGAITEDLTAIPSGNYSCTITDENGCQLVSNIFQVNSPTAISLTVDNNPLTCNGDANGVIDIMPSNGTAPYTFEWSNGATTEDLSGLTAGAYSLTITDDEGCIFTETIEVTEPLPIIDNAIVKNITCNGFANGSVEVSPQNGAGGYTYLWSDGSNDNFIGGLSQGIVNLTITDSDGCIKEFSYTITEPEQLTIDLGTPQQVICIGESITLLATVAGGTGAYDYDWSNGDTTPEITETPIADITYIIRVTDEEGCSSSTSHALAVDVPPTLSSEYADGLSLTLEQGEAINLNLDDFYNNEDASYDWSIDMLNTINSPTNTAGTTTDLLSESLDVNGESYTGTAVFTISPMFDNSTCTGDELLIDVRVLPNNSEDDYELPAGIFIPEIFTPNGDNRNDTWQIQFSRGVDANEYQYTIFNRNGAMVQASSSSADEAWTGTEVPDGAYFVIVEAKDGSASYKGGITKLSQ